MSIRAYDPRVLIDWSREVTDQVETYWHDQFRPRLDGLSDAE